MSPDITSMTMTEIIRLQNDLSKELKRRFERHLALAFSDIVGSTSYFAHHGDEAGRKLQQRHVDLLQQCIGGARGGRIVDTAGDGAFMCFPSVDAALDAVLAFHTLLQVDNADRPRGDHLDVRLGLHWGPVLTDEVQVTGDAVNLCARIAGSAQIGEIRLSREASDEISDPAKRLSSVPLPPAELKGIPRPVEMARFDWRDRHRFPECLRIEETDQDITLPSSPTITFGRLRPGEGVRGNDIVLLLPDPEKMMRVSRWHFELRRRPDGLVLRQVSDNVTEVEGELIARGAEVPIRSGTVVRVGNVMTLVFDSGERSGDRDAALATRY
jgi:class 3 adenylate cyclase